MVTKHIYDYYDKIIEAIPELQLLKKKEAYSIIAKIIKHGFHRMHFALKEDPYTIINLSAGFTRIYLTNKYAYKLKKRQLYKKNWDNYHESIDVDETRLPDDERAELEKQQADRSLLRWAQKRKTDPCKQPTRPDIQKKNAEAHAVLQPKIQGNGGGEAETI